MSVTLMYLAYSVSKVCDFVFVRLTGIGCGRLSMATVIRLWYEKPAWIFSYGRIGHFIERICGLIAER